MTRRNSNVKHLNRSEFGRYLAEVRTKAGLSQEEMEKHIGLKKSYINSLEQGVIHQPGPDKINKIVSGYKLNEEDVLEVFYGNPEEALSDEHSRLDGILESMKKDGKLRKHLLPALAEPMGIETKKLVIRLYETMTGKQLL